MSTLPNKLFNKAEFQLQSRIQRLAFLDRAHVGGVPGGHVVPRSAKRRPFGGPTPQLEFGVSRHENVASRTHIIIIIIDDDLIADGLEDGRELRTDEVDSAQRTGDR